MPKSRAERDRGRGETPSKRALRGAQKIGRQDPERGVTSRARKRRQGLERAPDPRYGGRRVERDQSCKPSSRRPSRTRSAPVFPPRSIGGSFPTSAAHSAIVGRARSSFRISITY